MMFAVVQVVAYGILVKAFNYNCLILYELLHSVNHQILEAILSVIESRQSERCLRILRESLLSDAKASDQARV